MGKFLKISVLALLLFAMPNNAESKAKLLTAAETGKIQQVVASVKPANMGIGDLKVMSTQVDGTELQIDLSDNFGDIPFTRESIEQLRSDIVNSLGEKYTDYTVKLSIANNDIERYFVDFEDSFKRSHKPFVTSADPMRHYDKGLDGNIIAMWPSHGWYFEPLLNRWEWQRARLFQTVEDMYTHSYVLPFLIPMLENAGAYVWNARERDTHEIMAVVDNDGSLAQNGYSEHNGSHKWRTGDGKGFAYKQNAYRDFENPFMSGTYREVAAVADEKNASVATWDVDMPEAGSYAVYVSYRTQPNSVSDAHYTINSLAGAEEFVVDQTMGGGVWVYLGTFELKKGVNKAVVKLSNYSQSNGVVTADAVKVGGGMGNIERRVALPTEKNKAIAAEQKNEKYLGKPDVEYKYVGSNRPWFMLGSRYYMQWAGFPDTVYSTSHGINDYVDDYRSRGEWVNYLAGGSEVLPNQKGLNVPVDLSFCLHTDAGTTPNDDIVGTLSIYCTKKDGNDFGNYENGTKRILSRTFADMISTEVVNDIRAKYEPNWSRRGMWDKPYYEARVPEVPALLVELLSHQNFADMKYGLDPNFRFDVSRSFYKAMVKFIASRDKREYEIQPLPVNAFAIAADGDSKFVLTWKPTVDELCDKAEAKQYIVYERVGEGGFKQVAVTADTRYETKVNDNEIHSYRIVAVNGGGRSFPSETLSCGVPRNSKGMVAVVNDFTRVSAPDWFDAGEIAGFYDDKDHGVPYIQQINYIGSQFEFRRSLEWRDDDAPGFGASRSNHEHHVIAGNTFDYPAVHGEAIMQAGYAFTSSSVKAVEDGSFDLTQYKLADLIMGKQKETMNGRGAYPSRYKALGKELRNAIENYTKAGGSIFVSGAYVGSDIWDKKSPDAAEVKFAENVLGFKWVNGRATLDGSVYTVPTKFSALHDGMTIGFVSELNSEKYAVESPDAIKASDSKGATFMRYTENNIPAGIVSNRAGYRTVVMGFPFEVITSSQARNTLMDDVLKFLSTK